jgi:putative hydrolase of the HAD superfamily
VSIKIIAFDYGGVLGSDSDNWDTNFIEVSRAAGVSPSELGNILDKHWGNLSRGKGDMSDFWREVYESSSNGNLTPGVLEKLYADGITINEDVLGYAKELKSKGLRLVVFSNETKEWMGTKIRKFDLLKTFEKVYLSADLGFSKSEDEAFEFFLSDLMVNPSEIVFIDDREKNITKANSFGISGVKFENLQQLKSDLMRLL